METEENFIGEWLKAGNSLLRSMFLLLLNVVPISKLQLLTKMPQLLPIFLKIKECKTSKTVKGSIEK